MITNKNFNSDFFRKQLHQPGWNFTASHKFPTLFLVVGLFLLDSAQATPFNGCTFYKDDFVSPSYSDGEPDSGCADFSAVNGRDNCKIWEGVCPACFSYPGDHVQMWLPDYFIEVTKHTGRSIFAEDFDGKAFKTHLKLGVSWWESSTKTPVNPVVSNGMTSSQSRESFWHARILVVPYGSLANNYPPLGSSKGVGLPVCYSALSEFLPAQWNYNLADGAFAFAWSPVGILACLSPAGAVANEVIGLARNKVTALANAPGLPNQSLPVDLACANPVGAKEAYLKNLVPGSAALAPLSGDIKNSLCMGSWGNLMPRTGWITNEDPFMSAMMAAYKFQSAAGDFHLNNAIKPRSSDKWQIVYPPRSSNKCFSPGSATLGLPPAMESIATRMKDETSVGNVLKDGTYVIAVWRKRTACKRPTQFIKGYDNAFKINFKKNKGICDAAGRL